MNPSHSTLKVFSDACQELYAPGLRTAVYSERSLTFLQRILPSEFIACGILDLPHQKLSIEFNSPHSAFGPAMESLGRLMHKYPLYNWDPTVNNGRPFCRSHFYSLRQFRDLDLYREVYLPLGIDNHCAMHVPTRPGEVMFFGLERKGGPDFSPADLALLEAAQTQLTNVSALARTFEEAAEEKVDPVLLTSWGLTPREAEVLSWMNEGKSNAEIALLLKIGLYSVKAHVLSIFNKTGVGNRLAAVVWARRTCNHFRGRDRKSPSLLIDVSAAISRNEES